MIFLSCALFWKEVLAHAAPRVSSLAHKAVLPSLSHSFPLLSLQNGNTALAIAKRLGYISVVDTLKVVTEEVTTTTTVSTRQPICSCPLGFPATCFSLSVGRLPVELLLLNAL